MYANYIVQLKFVYWTKMSILSSAIILKGWYFCIQTMLYFYNTNLAGAGQRQRTHEAHNICKVFLYLVFWEIADEIFVTFLIFFSLFQVSLCHISRNNIPVEVANSSYIGGFSL